MVAGCVKRYVTLTQLRLMKSLYGVNNCTQCLACIHLCPTKAIQYGKGTEEEGISILILQLMNL